MPQFCKVINGKGPDCSVLYDRNRMCSVEFDTGVKSTAVSILKAPPERPK